MRMKFVSSMIFPCNLFQLSW